MRIFAGILIGSGLTLAVMSQVMQSHERAAVKAATQAGVDGINQVRDHCDVLISQQAAYCKKGFNELGDHCIALMRKARQ